MKMNKLEKMDQGKIKSQEEDLYLQDKREKKRSSSTAKVKKPKSKDNLKKETATKKVKNKEKVEKEKKIKTKKSPRQKQETPQKKRKLKKLDFVFGYSEVPPESNTAPSLDLSEASLWALLQKHQQFQQETESSNIRLVSFPGKILSSTAEFSQNKYISSNCGLVVKTQPAIVSVVTNSTDSLKHSLQEKDSTNQQLFDSVQQTDKLTPSTEAAPQSICGTAVESVANDTEPMCEYLPR
mmetsp:Transcript_3438/g.4815  ORF Transcript_3438/g.4815 Transcript_3438/m.4815 type:complete len:239 (+) Transcript_3438:269-985(+)